MVSTRGFKPKFGEGERVLCYEPDPTKAKVLYESKVLQVIQNKEGRSKKAEYLIHFQGWNASWDRCVDEDLVLKDSEENRELQKTLLENAQIRFKEKKKKRRLSDTIREIVQEKEKQKREKSGSESGSQVGYMDDDDPSSSLSDQESLGSGRRGSSAYSESVEGGVPEGGGGVPYCAMSAMAVASVPCNVSDEVYTKEFPVDIPIALKAVLERDHMLIKEKNKLVKLPNHLSVLSVLENYVLFFSSRYLARTSERRRTETKLKDKSYLTLDMCKEVMDGLRICFDFHCVGNLLYTQEQNQATKLLQMEPPAPPLTSALQNKPSLSSSNKDEGDDVAQSGNRRLTRSGGRSVANDCGGINSSHQACDSGRSTPITGGSSSVCSSGQQVASSTGLPVLRPPLLSSTDLSQWTLLPVEHRSAGTPVLVYGALHLLRLFVKLPEILYRMNLPPEKKKIVLKHIHLFLEYLDVHNQDFFSESHYIPNCDVT